MKKYELYKKEGELWRIKALIDIPSSGVKKGDLGGLIENEKNLDQSGNAWVYGNARVSGNAWVYGDAWVSGSARVYGNAQVYGDAWVYGSARVSGDAWVSHSNGCIFLLFTEKFNVTLTSHVQIGCQQYTFEEFYGICKEEAIAEGYTIEQFEELQSILIPLMIRMERFK